ncbi:tetratricopeptide-like helical domain-containing protein [Artemisia annua]|uniref:Tetratricopeptide-like helical domain-containing protein n=1 Tax=Artemisia annua TaxID=35608 RepID=A0A2U1PVK6_ARTAN|nr:tetratricopeptide-like helical domain-containing protein [Artemisia annua]
MGQNGVLGDEYTFSTLTKVCGVVGDLGVGKCVKYGLVSDSVLMSSLMSMYGKCGGREDLCRVSEEMPKRRVLPWNVMLSRCAGEDGEKVFSFVKLDYSSRHEDPGSEVTLGGRIIPFTCETVSGRFDYGRELHCYIIRNEMNVDVDSSVHLDFCLIYMYSRRNKVSLARVIFDRMRFKNAFAWTAMMRGYLQNSDPDETVLIFREMLRHRVELNEVTLLTLLSTCSLVGGLSGVEQVHVKVYDHVCFSKRCNRVEFYNIGGMCNVLHGKGQEAVDLYEKMLTSGIKPNAISVVGVLSACSRSGLVEKGLDVYDKAISIYGIEPTMEMCSCMVDLLGRSDHETRVMVYNVLIKVEPENPSTYVLLSNLYASSKNWDYVANVRRKMNERSLKRLPGCSWITINSKTHSFVVADKAHPASDKIYEILNGLILDF